ncbi:MAG: cysteine synthase A [Bacteroidales bacterium]|nr:cysteine synthase A [Bacteroidales bacterium]
MPSLIDLIGNTPLIEFLNTKIFLKFENKNPGGSVKDRIAYSMIKDAENKGLINKDSVIIEPTSGNTGIGLALICAIKGYKCIITMPENMSIERRIILKMLNAEVVLTPENEGIPGSIEKAKELKSLIKNSFIPDQFSNLANPQMHYTTTGPEIYTQMHGKIDVFVAGVGTGGTLTGVGKYLKEKLTDVKIFAVEPTNSAVLSGKKHSPHKIQGIGPGFIPPVLDTSIYDGIVTISDDEAIEMVKYAYSKGIMCGISAGANICAALKLKDKPEFKNKNIVTIIPDGGEKYLQNFITYYS